MAVGPGTEITVLMSVIKVPVQGSFLAVHLTRTRMFPASGHAESTQVFHFIVARGKYSVGALIVSRSGISR
jgi:hypothetical protein